MNPCAASETASFTETTGMISKRELYLPQHSVRNKHKLPYLNPVISCWVATEDWNSVSKSICRLDWSLSLPRMNSNFRAVHFFFLKQLLILWG